MDSLESLPLIGPKTLEKLHRLNIFSPADLLKHYPRRYLDFSHKKNISDIKEGDTITVETKVISFTNIFTRTHKNIQKAIVTDKSQARLDVIWFNQPYLSASIKPGLTLAFAGTVSSYQNKPCLFNPEIGLANTGKIIPIYPETNGLSSKQIRKIITTNFEFIIKNTRDLIPDKIINKYKLKPLINALRQVHFPEDIVGLENSRTRLALDEILSLEASSILLKNQWSKHRPHKSIVMTKKSKDIILNAIKNLPFKLTVSQKEAWRQITSDLTNPEKVMNRLLEGDVGSGKTVVAMLACYLTSLNQSYSVLIAPTEVLAKQHFYNFKKLFPAISSKIHLLTSSHKINIEKLSIDSVIISTHAVIYQKAKLIGQTALVIIDEQHKFGVKQRNFLNEMNLNSPPHCLTMTATPIPRTISMSILGNLDISILQTKPEGRQQIKSFLVPKHKIDNCYKWLSNDIKTRKTQAFIVCPFIEESENLDSVKSVTQEFRKLSESTFSHLKLGLLHSKLNNKSKQETLDKFVNGQTNILVTTPIIEVGVDIPNATTIIIQSSDRFGLAQLHQLRGRVGRGENQSYCYFFTESDNQKTLNRLHYLEKHHDGLEIAEFDLKNRGPGEIFSTLQHGFPSLKLASFDDLKLIYTSQAILNEIQKLPSSKKLIQQLSNALNPGLKTLSSN